MLDTVKLALQRLLLLWCPSIYEHNEFVFGACLMRAIGGKECTLTLGVLRRADEMHDGNHG
jgi:hypothetical protein